MATLRPTALAALRSLAAFGVLAPGDALALLGCWSRRAELTSADLASIVAHLGTVDSIDGDR